MKKMFFIAALTAASFVGMAQKSASSQGFKFQVGLDLGIPANNLPGTSIAAGADLLGLYRVSDNIGITGDVGYTAIFPKGGGSTLNLVPIRAGLRVYPSEDFYVGGKIGVGLLSGGGSSTTTTAYSFGAGYMISPKIDLGASYDGYSKNGSIGLINIRLGFLLN